MANGINKVILLGNLGRDPDIREYNGKKRAALALATSRSWKNINDEAVTKTEWHNVIIWSPLAEICGEYLKKGSQIYIEGSLVTRSYKDAAGNKKYTTEVVASNMLMLGAGGTPKKPKNEEEASSIEEEPG